jgi:hypothetical protein
MVETRKIKHSVFLWRGGIPGKTDEMGGRDLFGAKPRLLENFRSVFQAAKPEA